MAILETAGTTQPLIDPASSANGNVSASAPCLLSAEDWASIEEGERDADDGRFVSDEDMTKLVPGW